MKTIKQIESQLGTEHKHGLDIFAHNSFDRTTLVSMLTAAYLSGQADAMREELECLKKAPASR